jgi:hypothetical protein
MPKRFRFFIDDELNFQCNLKTKRCEGQTKTGTQCRRNTVMGTGYCYQHLETIKHLKIKASTIPGAGLGLFCFDRKKQPNEIIFRENDIIIEYDGDKVSDNELVERYGDYTAPYAIHLVRTENIDSACLRGIGAFVNHKPHTQANARLANNRNYTEARVTATKNIRNGSEIFASYGNSYHINEAGAKFTTK